MTNPTLKKIAETLGISVSTVSRALKKHPDISAATRQKVMDLAQTLDYEPNASAVQLRTRNSKLFGILVPSISNYFYESFIAAIEEAGRKNGYSIIILQSGNDPEIEQVNLKLFRQNRISGLFACITPQTKDLAGFDKLRELETPVIFFDKVPPGQQVQAVCLADSAAGKMAAEAILHKKKKVLALFGDPQLLITQKRIQAFTQTLTEHNKTITLQTAHTCSSEEARVQTNRLLDDKNNRPDTIFCMSDEILIGVMKALQENDLRPPAAIAVIAISNGFIPKLFYPEITYVETSGKQLGELAFARMLQCIEGKLAPEEIILESRLVEGGSL